MDNNDVRNDNDNGLRSGLMTEARIEALLFAFGDPLTDKVIMKTLDIGREEFDEAAERLRSKYDKDNSAIRLRQLGEKYTLCTKSEYNDDIRQLVEPESMSGLSNAAFETLAVIAYHQPVTRARVEKIRGVNSDSPVHTLLEKGLIERVGKLDVPGHPTLYGTTELFLKDFGYETIEDLPEIRIEGQEDVFEDEKFSEMDVSAGVQDVEQGDIELSQENDDSEDEELNIDEIIAETSER